MWPVSGDQSGEGCWQGRRLVINTECSKRWNLAPSFIQFHFPFVLTSLPLLMPLPHYLSALSYHCCDYGCHAVVKRTAINRPEIKPKNEFPQCRPHALLSRNYLAGVRLITPVRRQRQEEEEGTY